MRVAEPVERPEMAELVPPHSLEAEQAVLGALLLHSDAWPAAGAILIATDFYREAHQRVFVAMTSLLERGQSIDLITVKDALASTGELVAVGGPAYLSSLVDGLPNALHVAEYAGIVRKYALLRGSLDVSQALTTQAMAYDADPELLIDRAVAQLRSLSGRTTPQATRARKAVLDYVDGLDAGTIGAAVLTGYEDLDTLLGGLQLGQLVVVAARTSVGKTTWALGAAQAMARREEAVAFITLEMSCTMLAAQLLAWRSRVPSERLRRQAASEQDYVKISDAMVSLEDAPLFIVESARTLSQIAAWSRRLKEEHGVKCIVVDYLQLLTAERRHQSREVEVAAIVRGLKRIAVDLGVVVLALAQVSRAPEGRCDKRPHLSDLRESGAIEQDTDVALLLFREELYKRKPENEGIAECIVAKNRTGPTGIVMLAFDRHLAQFSNLNLRP